MPLTPPPSTHRLQTAIAPLTLRCLLGGALLSLGCARPQPVVSASALPDPGSGYVVGLFSGVSSEFAFGLVETTTQKDYLMPFFTDRKLTTKHAPDQVNMIAVPPGSYRIAYWVTYDKLTKEISTRTQLNGPNQPSPFAVDAGKIAYLGSYSTSQERSFSYNTTTFTYRVTPNRVPLSGFLTLFKDKYPEFHTSDITY